MRTYTIDELDTNTLRHLEEYLTEAGLTSGIEKLYWLPLTASQLAPIQKEHEESCGPHCLALEVLDDGVRLELLVRAKGRMRCECIQYALPETQQLMMQQLDELIAGIQEEELKQLFGTCC